MNKLLLIGAAITLLGSAVAWGRQWTDSTGEHTIEAEFVEVVDAQDHSVRGSPTEDKDKERGPLFVRLKKQDGQIVKVPLEKLSQKDQQFIQLTDLKRSETDPTGHRSGDRHRISLTRVPLSRSASKQLDDALVEGVKAAHTPTSAEHDHSGKVMILSTQSASFAKGKQENLKITVAGKSCEISHNWRWSLIWNATSIERAMRGQFPVNLTCPPPSGSIRLTALTDLPLVDYSVKGGVQETVSAGSVLIHSGKTWVVIQKGQDGTEKQNDAVARDKKGREHVGTEAGRSKPQSKAGEQ